jgi:hypothetical protein
MEDIRPIAIAFLLVVTAFTCGCATNRVAGELKNIAIAHQSMSSRPNDADFVKMCKEFTLTKPDIKQYFTKAKKITRSILHDKYNLYPCYSEGNAELNKKEVTWRIHAGGIGFIRFDDTEVVYACDEKNCNSIKGLY